MNFPFAQLTHPGQRLENEDYLASRQVGDGWLWGLADGLGGMGGGSEASFLALDTAMNSFASCVGDPRDRFRQAVGDAHLAIRNRQMAGGSRSMSTTLVLLYSSGTNISWCHIGDSRLYVFRDGKQLHRTSDHSLVQHFLERGEIPGEGVTSNMLLQAIGMDSLPKLSFGELSPVMPWDAFLICSDGFWNHLLEEEMLIALWGAASPRDWLARMLKRLSERVNARPATLEPIDNFSAITLFAEPKNEH